MASLSDVARQAGVSPATASRVLSGGASVALKTRERVVDAALQLGYRPNVLAQGLRRGRGRTIALVTGDIGQGIYPALAKEVQRRLAEMDLDLLLFDMAHREERLAHLLERSTSLGLRGLLLAVPRTLNLERMLPLIQAAAASGIATVSISQRLDAHGVTSIVPDDFAGALEAVRYLGERGRGPLAYLGRIGTSAVGRQRFEGYRQAFADAGQALDPDLVWDIERGERFEAGYEALQSALRKGQRFGAVLAASDELALGGMAAAIDADRSIPRDIAFVGFGGVHWGHYTRPALTTMSHDVGALADAVRRHFRALADEQDSPVLTLVPLKLVVRSST